MQWVPLESNPEVLTTFARALGASKGCQFSDVWSPEPDLLALVPSKRYAVIFLFPLTERMLAAEASGDTTTDEASGTPDVSPPFFCKQTIGNACGTIALIHSVLNACHGGLPIEQGSFFQEFQQETQSMSPSERASALEASKSLRGVHSTFANQGQTAAPDASEKIELHFVAFVVKDGVLYELDGRRNAPVSRGASTDATLLEDSCQIIKQEYMARDPDEVRFTILALTDV